MELGKRNLPQWFSLRLEPISRNGRVGSKYVTRFKSGQK